MWVISKSKLRDYWESPQGRGIRQQLEDWHQIVDAAEWRTFADVKTTFGAGVDLVGDCVVFDIAGNHFRLIARIRFATHKVFVLSILTHAEYDTDRWKADCGCFNEPPVKKANLRDRKPAAKVVRKKRS